MNNRWRLPQSRSRRRGRAGSDSPVRAPASAARPRPAGHRHPWSATAAETSLAAARPPASRRTSRPASRCRPDDRRECPASSCGLSTPWPGLYEPSAATLPQSRTDARPARRFGEARHAAAAVAARGKTKAAAQQRRRPPARARRPRRAATAISTRRARRLLRHPCRPPLAMATLLYAYSHGRVRRREREPPGAVASFANTPLVTPLFATLH